MLGREKAVLLRQGQNPSSDDTFQDLSKHVKKGNRLPGSKSWVVPFARLLKGNSVAVAEGSAVVGKIDTSLKEGLEVRDKRAPKAFENKKRNAVAACCLEGVRFFND